MNPGKIDHPGVVVVLVLATMLAVTPLIAESPGALLITATKRGALKLVQQLLKQGVVPNSYDAVHNTPLIFAARDGRQHIARALIEAGASVNWMDDEHVTPLILAALKGHTDLVVLLLAHGADPTIRDQWNRTALDYALRRGEDHPIVKSLRHAEHTELRTDKWPATLDLPGRGIASRQAQYDGKRAHHFCTAAFCFRTDQC